MAAQPVLSGEGMHRPRWLAITLALLAVAWLGAHIACGATGFGREGSVTAQQTARHSGDACGLSSLLQTFATRWTLPAAGKHFAKMPPAHGLAHTPIPAQPLAVADTSQSGASDIPPRATRHLTPRWTHAPPSLI